MQKLEISVEDLPKQIRKAGHQLLFKEVIGKGAFGIVCLYESIKGQKFAIKFEHSKATMKNLLQESINLKKIHDKNSIGAYSQTRTIMIPQYISHGYEQSASKSDEGFNILIMDFFEEGLDNFCLKNPNDKIELEQFREIALKMFNAVKSLHQANYIHRDIKPDNFRMSNEDVYLVDLGSCKSYIDESGKHIKFNENQAHRGTPFTASISAHENYEVARIDDLISLIYSLMMLTGEKLPWSDNTNTSQMYNGKRIQDLKKELKADYFQFDVNKRLFEILVILEKQLYSQFQGVDVDYNEIEGLLNNINETVQDQFKYQNIINDCKIVKKRNLPEIKNNIISIESTVSIPKMTQNLGINQISVISKQNVPKISNLGNLVNIIPLKPSNLTQQTLVATMEFIILKTKLEKQTNIFSNQIVAQKKQVPQVCNQSQQTDSNQMQPIHDEVVTSFFSNQSQQNATNINSQNVNKNQFYEINKSVAISIDGISSINNLDSDYFNLMKDIKYDKFDYARMKQGQPITNFEDLQKLQLQNQRLGGNSSQIHFQNSQNFDGKQNQEDKLNTILNILEKKQTNKSSRIIEDLKSTVTNLTQQLQEIKAQNVQFIDIINRNSSVQTDWSAERQELKHKSYEIQQKYYNLKKQQTELKESYENVLEKLKTNGSKMLEQSVQIARLEEIIKSNQFRIDNVKQTNLQMDDYYKTQSQNKTNISSNSQDEDISMEIKITSYDNNNILQASQNQRLNNHNLPHNSTVPKRGQSHISTQIREMPLDQRERIKQGQLQNTLQYNDNQNQDQRINEVSRISHQQQEQQKSIFLNNGEPNKLGKNASALENKAFQLHQPKNCTEKDSQVQPKNIKNQPSKQPAQATTISQKTAIQFNTGNSTIPNQSITTNSSKSSKILALLQSKPKK
eukprot:403348196